MSNIYCGEGRHGHQIKIRPFTCKIITNLKFNLGRIKLLRYNAILRNSVQIPQLVPSSPTIRNQSPLSSLSRNSSSRTFSPLNTDYENSCYNTDNSRWHNLVIARTYFPWTVFTLTVRTRPSFPGYTSSILPRFHRPRGTFLSMINTKSSTWKSRWICCHFFRRRNSGTHSFIQRVHTCRTGSWTRLHRFRATKSTVSTVSGANSPPTRPCRKWLGVSGRSSEGWLDW